MNKLNTDALFAGGGGMFIEFHDIIKPVYLHAIISMLIGGNTFGFPIDLLQDFSLGSILEWYKFRQFRNPLQQLDWQHKVDKEIADEVMDIILEDETIYTLAPTLNIELFLEVYKSQFMEFPWFVYSEKEEPGIPIACDQVFQSIPYKYVYGDLKECISKCSQNFTYIFSDIEKVKNSAEILHGSYSHILLAGDYRYNYTDNFKTMRYSLQDIMSKHPFIRIGTTTAMDIDLMLNSFDNLIDGKEDS